MSGSARHREGRRRLWWPHAALLASVTAGLLSTRWTGPDHRAVAPALGATAMAAQSLVAAGDLKATEHPPPPLSAAEAWLVPDVDEPVPPADRALARAKGAFAGGRFAEVLALLPDGALEGSPVAAWAAYYRGLALAKLARPAEAAKVFDAILAQHPEGYLAEGAALAAVDAAESMGDTRRSLTLLQTLAGGTPAAPDEVLKRLAEVASRAGEGGVARSAWVRLYYEFPLSPHASLAEPAVAEVRAAAADRAAEVRARDVDRAERLFAARRWSEARAAFERLRAGAAGDVDELANLRVAECDYYLGRHRAALDRLAPYLERAARRAEAWFFHALALRALGRVDEYVARSHQLVSAFPDSSWAEDALNELGTYHIRANDDGAAAEVFRQIVERYPTSRHAERAAWKYGWWRYKLGELAEAAAVFEQAAIRAPRADHRPAWLYWAARARDQLGQHAEAAAIYRIAVADYGSSYYGRLAKARLGGLESAISPASAAPALARAGGEARPASTGGSRTDARARVQAAANDPPNAAVIRRLLLLGLWDEALSEVQYAIRAWGSTSRLQATLAYVYNRQGDLRRGITVMKRAWPQYLTDGGEQLPRRVLQVIYPLAYEDLIHKYARQRGLDPHLVSALIAQESTFQADARSAANAVGLMQILPSTGRRLAQADGLKNFTTRMLTRPDVNIRLGTRHLADLLRRFDGEHFALASYNAGEHRVMRWRAERPGLGREEFIDDIPFPETQNYVKRILGTAADYRRLYGAARRDETRRADAQP
jgi:soluble lytic murein transglycosylase